MPIEAASTQELGLYLHYPWCIQKCPYCDFNSYAVQKEQLQLDERYLFALLEDLKHSSVHADSRTITSIFLGGGTPSLLQPESVFSLMQCIKSHYRVLEDVEVTLEMNPATFKDEVFTGFKQAGVNRLSLGAQSFSNTMLERLGRVHRSDSIEQCAIDAANCGFKRINLDIMHRLPGQTIKQAMEDLSQAIALGTEHISWYELTYELGTVFAKTKPRRMDMDSAYELTKQGLALLAKNGYKRYEVSAYTRNRPCRHNLNYWKFGDYIGCGAGAHSKLTTEQGLYRWQKSKAPRGYMSAPCSYLYKRRLTSSEALFEYMLNHLRLDEPVKKDHFELRTQSSWQDLCSMILASDKAASFLWPSDNTLRLTEEARWFLDDCVAVFLHDA